uniref:Uncharacterized protein n=1 Tax=Moniliophthora roreri TaxID=221103 RepID=A0A0W0FSA3_MONRR
MAMTKPLYAYKHIHYAMMSSKTLKVSKSYSLPDQAVATLTTRLKITGCDIVKLQRRLITGVMGYPKFCNLLMYMVPILNKIKSQFNKIISDTQINNWCFTVVNFFTEPYTQSNVQSTDSAYPHPPGRFVCLTLLEIRWDNVADDAYFISVLLEAQQAIQAVAIVEEQSFADDILYPNNAPGNTPLELLYGDNLERLRVIKKRVDLWNVMGSTGGFKI